jgi:hypothetical protein
MSISSLSLYIYVCVCVCACVSNIIVVQMLSIDEIDSIIVIV